MEIWASGFIRGLRAMVTSVVSGISVWFGGEQYSCWVLMFHIGKEVEVRESEWPDSVEVYVLSGGWICRAVL